MGVFSLSLYFLCYSLFCRSVSFSLYFFFSLLFCLFHFIFFFLSLFVLFNLGGSFVLVRVKQAVGFYRVFIIKIRGGGEIVQWEMQLRK